MLRKQISAALTQAMRAQEKRRMATLRLVNCAIKDRDIAARSNGQHDGIGEADIQQLLHKMVKQRQESSIVYEEAGRLELAQQEREEIEIIGEFLPQQMEGDQLVEAVTTVLGEVGATSVKDMGSVMAELKTRFAGQMDFGKASGVVRSMLTQQAAQ